jgi:serine/tyrosine/threonine adenylyltransferase
VNDGYFAPFESLLTVLSMPYEDQPAFGRYVDPPRPDQVVHQTRFAVGAHVDNRSVLAIR